MGDLNTLDFSDAEVIDIDCYEETRQPWFSTGEVRSDFWPCVTWYWRNFGRMTESVWWGYKVGYYLVAWPSVSAFLAVVDLVFVIVLYRGLWRHVGVPLIALAFEGMRPFAKIIMGALALIIVTLFIANQGWDGLNELYKWLCGSLSDMFSGSPSQA